MTCQVTIHGFNQAYAGITASPAPVFFDRISGPGDSFQEHYHAQAAFLSTGLDARVVRPGLRQDPQGTRVLRLRVFRRQCQLDGNQHPGQGRRYRSQRPVHQLADRFTGQQGLFAGAAGLWCVLHFRRQPHPVVRWHRTGRLPDPGQHLRHRRAPGRRQFG
ncbi:hypothetical protein D3C81_1794000 [compost metagenome]